MFDQIHPGELHHLPNLLLVVTAVTWGPTLLAHGFGIMRTLHPHGQTVGEKPVTLRTEKDLLLTELFDIEESKGERGFFSTVILPAEDRDKLYQNPNVDLLFF